MKRSNIFGPIQLPDAAEDIEWPRQAGATPPEYRHVAETRYTIRHVIPRSRSSPVHPAFRFGQVLHARSLPGQGDAARWDGHVVCSLDVGLSHGSPLRLRAGVLDHATASVKEVASPVHHCYGTHSR
jgi:hypothetical protein